MIKTTLKYEYGYQTSKIMAVLLLNNIDIQSNRHPWDYYYITCVFEDATQLNRILLTLNERCGAVWIHRKRELFDFNAFWEKLKELWNK